MSKSNLAAVMSAVVWGSGQIVISKQYTKGFLFLLLQMIFISIELSTGYWYENAVGLVEEFSIGVYGGFFTKGIWGLFTLGEYPKYDHSIMLLVTGIIAILVLSIFIYTYVKNIIDARKTQIEFEKTKVQVGFVDFFKNLYDKIFAQIVLTPILILFLMIIVMPIICTVLIAFTNYSKTNLPPANLVNWVGFENVSKLFNVPIWSDTFLSILGWTIVWTVAVTFISYFTGLIQAIMLNNIEGRMKKIEETSYNSEFSLKKLKT